MRTRGTGCIVRRRRGGIAIRYYDAQGREHFESVAKALGKPVAQTTEQDAERYLRHRLGEIEGGLYQAPQSLTVAHLLDAKLTNFALRKVKSLGHIRGVMTYLTAELGHLRANELRTDHIERWMRRAQASGLKDGTIALRAAYLKAALTYAVRTGRLTAVPYFQPLKVENARQGFLEPAEIERLIAHAEPPLGDVIRFARLVGWRRSEILSLTWSMVDRVHGELRIPTSKNGDPQVVPLSGDLAVLIEQRWRGRALGSPHVFHRKGRALPPATCNQLFRTARAAAGVPEARLHDLRRVAYRELLAAGVDVFTTMDLCHHKTQAMAKRYAIRNTRLMARGLLQRDAFLRGDAAARQAES